MDLLSVGDRFFAFIKSLLGDLLQISPRRTSAIARLAIKESVRKQAGAALVIFLIVLAFALWFIDNESIDPGARNIHIVMYAVNFLMLVTAILISTFSLPNDVKQKTIYTVVTKPVRPSEIVLGRMLGFATVCIVPLALMTAGSYFFVVRSLDHRHELTETDLRPLPTDPLGRTPAGSKQGTTSTAQNHRHRIVLGPDGRGVTEMNDADRLKLDDASSFQDRFGRTHHHVVTSELHDGRTVYDVGPPLGQFHARVPIKGTLTFREKDGSLSEEGLNVGNWTKRGYVAGGTQSAAVFRFAGVTPNVFPDGLRLEMDIRLFRTTKVDMDKPILGSLRIRNPVTGLTSAPRNFAAREYFTLDQFLPRSLADSSGKPVDLFDDLVVNGEVIVELQCIPRSQLFGVGPDDVYLLARENRFELNFAKGFVGIGLQMLLTIVLGVVFSTFLSGPVAMLATAASVGAALLRPFLLNVVRDNLYEGAARTGGFFESTIRTLGQRSVSSELEKTATNQALQTVDSGLNFVIERLLLLIPDFTAMSETDRVAAGFDVPWHDLAADATQSLLFAVPLFLIGLVIFKLTEVGK